MEEPLSDDNKITTYTIDEKLIEIGYERSKQLNNKRKEICKKKCYK